MSVDCFVFRAVNRGKVMIKRAMSAACMCVPMSAMAQPAQLSGQDLGELLPGATIQIDAPLGYKLPVRFGTDGTMTGEAGELASYLGSPTDNGKWWVKGDQVCHKWSKWLDSKLQCLRLRKDGRVLHWTSQDGDSGTATITVMAPPRSAPASTQVAGLATAPIAPKLIATVPEERTSEPPRWAEMPAPRAAAQPSTTLPPAPRLAAADTMATSPAPRSASAASVVAPQAAVPASVQNAGGVRNMATPPMTAPRVQTASFVVTNVRADDVLNVRSGPSSDFEVVAALKPGSRGVAITGACQSDWCPVRHQDATGWVNSVYLADEIATATTVAMRTPAREAQPAAIPAKTPVTAYRGSPDAPRTCLTAAARALLQTIEGRFGPVRVVSTCRAGATIAGTGRPSRHASGNAVDFDAGARKGEILRWLIANHRSGGTMTYPDMDHIHVDIGPHFVSIAGGQKSASWRGSSGGRASAQDDDD
jgi:uncharacterized protein YraI